MLIKLLLLLLIILIALFLIIFSEPIHISVDFKFIEELKKGHVEVKYYFIKIIKSLDEGYLKINFDTRFFSKNLKVIYQEDDEDDMESTDSSEERSVDDNQKDVDASENTDVDTKTSDSQSEDNNTSDMEESQGKFYLIRKYTAEIMDLKDDLFDILLSLKNIIFLDDNYMDLSFGIGDNNSTIKISTFLWAITAPFYAAGLKVKITPIMNELKLRLLLRLDFELSLLLLLKVIFKVVTNMKLLKLIIGVYNELS